MLKHEDADNDGELHDVYLTDFMNPNSSLSDTKPIIHNSNTNAQRFVDDEESLAEYEKSNLSTTNELIMNAVTKSEVIDESIEEHQLSTMVMSAIVKSDNTESDDEDTIESEINCAFPDIETTTYTTDGRIKTIPISGVSVRRNRKSIRLCSNSSNVQPIVGGTGCASTPSMKQASTSETRFLKCAYCTAKFRRSKIYAEPVLRHVTAHLIEFELAALCLPIACRYCRKGIAHFSTPSMLIGTHLDDDDADDDCGGETLSTEYGYSIHRLRQSTQPLTLVQHLLFTHRAQLNQRWQSSNAHVFNFFSMTTNVGNAPTIAIACRHCDKQLWSNRRFEIVGHVLSYCRSHLYTEAKRVGNSALMLALTTPVMKNCALCKSTSVPQMAYGLLSHFISKHSKVKRYELVGYSNFWTPIQSVFAHCLRFMFGADDSKTAQKIMFADDELFGACALDIDAMVVGNVRKTNGQIIDCEITTGTIKLNSKSIQLADNRCSQTISMPAKSVKLKNPLAELPLLRILPPARKDVADSSLKQPVILSSYTTTKDECHLFKCIPTEIYEVNSKTIDRRHKTQLISAEIIAKYRMPIKMPNVSIRKRKSEIITSPPIVDIDDDDTLTNSESIYLALPRFEDKSVNVIRDGAGARLMFCRICAASVSFDGWRRLRATSDAIVHMAVHLKMFKRQQRVCDPTGGESCKECPSRNLDRLQPIRDSLFHHLIGAHSDRYSDRHKLVRQWCLLLLSKRDRSLFQWFFVDTIPYPILLVCRFCNTTIYIDEQLSCREVLYGHVMSYIESYKRTLPPTAYATTISCTFCCITLKNYVEYVQHAIVHHRQHDWMFANMQNPHAHDDLHRFLHSLLATMFGDANADAVISLLFAVRPLSPFALLNWSIVDQKITMTSVSTDPVIELVPKKKKSMPSAIVTKTPAVHARRLLQMATKKTIAVKPELSSDLILSAYTPEKSQQPKSYRYNLTIKRLSKE